jgi:hypothetical protein
VGTNGDVVGTGGDVINPPAIVNCIRKVRKSMSGVSCSTFGMHCMCE